MEVKLKIFSFYIFSLIKLFHYEIEYDGKDYGFGRFGVYVTPSYIDKTVFGFYLERVIIIGTSNVDSAMFHEFVRYSVHLFNRETYSIWWRNCRHYAAYLLIELAPANLDIGIF